MCGTSDVETTTWQRELPNSEGEWLWVVQWSCGCVLCSGIAWVQPAETSPEGMISLSNGFCLSWEGQIPPNEKIEAVHGWKKINLPPAEWCRKHLREYQAIKKDMSGDC